MTPSSLDFPWQTKEIQVVCLSIRCNRFLPMNQVALNEYIAELSHARGAENMQQCKVSG